MKALLKISVPLEGGEQLWETVLNLPRFPEIDTYMTLKYEKCSLFCRVEETDWKVIPGMKSLDDAQFNETGMRRVDEVLEIQLELVQFQFSGNQATLSLEVIYERRAILLRECGWWRRGASYREPLPDDGAAQPVDVAPSPLPHAEKHDPTMTLVWGLEIAEGKAMKELFVNPTEHDRAIVKSLLARGAEVALDYVKESGLLY